MNWHRGYGFVQYDPDRGKMKKSRDWWCILNINNDIANYYRWYLEKHWWEFEVDGIKREYFKPSWGAHISICRGEIPSNKEFWKKYESQRIEFEYQHKIESVRELGFKDKFFIVRVHCPEINEIRKELGLRFEDSRGKPFTFHITIARTDDKGVI